VCGEGQSLQQFFQVFFTDTHGWSLTFQSGSNSFISIDSSFSSSGLVLSGRFTPNILTSAPFLSTSLIFAPIGHLVDTSSHPAYILIQ
jgi:hypothetical protein